MSDIQEILSQYEPRIYVFEPHVWGSRKHPSAPEIIKCVNCHDDLLEALKAITEVAQINIESESTAFCGPTMSYFDAMEKAFRAIAKAEGKPQ